MSDSTKGTTDEEREILAVGGTAAQRSGPSFHGSAAMPTEHSENFGATLRRLGPLLAGERLLLAAITVLTVVGVFLVVIGPRILGDATDIIFTGVTSGDGIDFDDLHRTLILVAILYLASALLTYIQGFALAGVVSRSMHRLRTSVEEKLNHLPLSYVDSQPRGDLLSRVTNDIDNLAQSLQMTISMGLTSVLTLIGVTVMMFSISPLMAVIALVIVPPSVWIIKSIGGRARPKYMAQWSHTGLLNAQVEEVFTGHDIVKSFGRQAEVEEVFSQENEQVYEASFGAQFMAGLIQPAMLFMGNVQYVLIAVVGGLRISSGAMTVGEMQALIQYTRMFAQPLSHLASMATLFQSGIASLERVLELLDADEESPDPEDPAPLGPVRGRVELDDVSFSYSPDEPLIEGLDVVAEPGQTVAIVGPTGAGKTTLVNLIMRFYDLDGGTIRLDGRDIASLPRQELRSQMGMVLQDTWLFSGTILENLRYGNPDATDEEVKEAARVTYVDRFVHSLPDGYDTMIDDEGGSISAGEKQLITIARAFLSDPSILILDEATSSVDTRTEVLIQEAMNNLRQDRTSFVIAHRLSTIRGADIILVMEAGRIVEQGSHHDLLAEDGAYASLYNSQFVGAAAEIS
jgi:ATP-binding cassette subfamily B multidrug efflux pump